MAEPLCPLIFNKDYKDSFKEIIYFANDKQSAYNHIKNTENLIFTSIDCYEYYFNKLWFPPNNKAADVLRDNSDLAFYAYGILINILNTKIVVFDYDAVELKDIEFNALYSFARNSIITQIDIAQTSGRSYHIYVGLDNFYNTLEFFNGSHLSSHMCQGFKKNATSKLESIVRVSEKMFRDNIRWTNIQFLRSYKKVNDKITMFDVDIKYKQPIELIKKRTINLRTNTWQELQPLEKQKEDELKHQLLKEF